MLWKLGQGLVVFLVVISGVLLVAQDRFQQEVVAQEQALAPVAQKRETLEGKANENSPASNGISLGKINETDLQNINQGAICFAPLPKEKEGKSIFDIYPSGIIQQEFVDRRTILTLREGKETRLRVECDVVSFQSSFGFPRLKAFGNIKISSLELEGTCNSLALDLNQNPAVEVLILEGEVKLKFRRSWFNGLELGGYFRWQDAKDETILAGNRVTIRPLLK
jgi:hypothetical protein